MKTLIFLMLVMPPAWGAPLLEGRGSQQDLADEGVHKHTDILGSPKLFNLNQFDVGDITVKGKVTGDKKVSIGHSVAVSIEDSPSVSDIKESHAVAAKESSSVGGKEYPAVPGEEASDSGLSRLNEKIEELDKNIKAIGELKTAIETIEVELKTSSFDREMRSLTNDQLSVYEKRFLTFMDIATEILKLCGKGDLCDINKLTDMKKSVNSIFEKIKQSGISSNAFKSSFNAKKFEFYEAASIAEEVLEKTQLKEIARISLVVNAVSQLTPHIPYGPYHTMSALYGLNACTAGEDRNCLDCGVENEPGVENESKVKISGGSYTEANQYPWMVQLPMGCGGSLITDRLVLTAKHCVQASGHNWRGTMVKFGVHNKNDMKDYEEVAIKDYVTPDADTIGNHDIAIIILEKPLDLFDNKIGTVCLPSSNDKDYRGKKATAMGWGMTHVGSSSSPVLKHVILEVSKYEQKNFLFTKIALVNGVPQDPCAGDSGGPLVYREKSGRWTIIGTVYGSGFDCRTGNTNGEGKWNKVTDHLAWIHNIMRQY